MCRHYAPTLRGCQKRWHVPIVAKPWKCNHDFHMGKCTTCRERSMMNNILWCFKTFTTSGTPKVPKSWKFSCACLGSDWDCVVGFNALTACTPKAPDSAKNSSLRRWSYYGSLSELRLFVVRTLNKLHWKLTCYHSSGLKMDMCWLLSVQLFWPCVKDALDWPLAECLEQAKLAQLLPC